MPRGRGESVRGRNGNGSIVEESMLMVKNSGKVFVFSGLIPICKDEDGLAAILGHEIAHNVAHHTGETLSSRWIVFALGLGVSYLFDISHQLVNSLLDIGYSKPGSRKQEVRVVISMNKGGVLLWLDLTNADLPSPRRIISDSVSFLNSDQIPK